MNHNANMYPNLNSCERPPRPLNPPLPYLVQHPSNPPPLPHFRFPVPNPNLNNNSDNAFPLYSSLPTNTVTPPPSLSSNMDSFQYTKQNNQINLNDSISLFKQLISHAEARVKDISDLLKLGSSNSDPDLLKLGLSSSNLELSSCPFNPQHRMPPQAMFRHYLSCPSSPAMVDLDILSSLRYPHSLKSDKDLNAETQLFKPLEGPQSDICISIEDEEGFLDCNLFYQDAPGVVNAAQQHGIDRTFILPGILSMECVNSDSGSEEVGLSGKHDITFLPSEFWALQTEVAGWNDFPSKYSLVALETSLGLGRLKGSEILKWIIRNSPAYGVIIDMPMTRHIFVLLKLCLKAISREAFGLHLREKEKKDISQNTDKNRTDMLLSIETMNKSPDLRTVFFDCPVLLESAGWLSSQFSILYGQAYGKGLVIGMLRHCFIRAGSALSYAFVDEEPEIANIQQDSSKFSIVDDDDASHQEVNVNENAVEDAVEFSVTTKRERITNAKMKINPSEFSCNVTSNVGNGDKFELADADILESRVFVSQVAAAVSALHERFQLEERIKGLRHFRRLSKYQLLAEHENAVRKATEERKRRPDYKPILEQDGLIWQRSSYQGTKREKTKEELLAEERDYKRRRMSYRGKKVKRTPTRVLHDIIEGHMEEIKLAGGIGCFVKGTFEIPQDATQPLPSDSVTESIQQFETTNSALPNRGEGFSVSSYQRMQSDSTVISSKRVDVNNMDFKSKRFYNTTSPQMSSQSFFDDGNRTDKHERSMRNDHSEVDSNVRCRSVKLYNDDNVRHYSSSTSEERFAERREMRHDSRSQHRKLDSSNHRHEGRHSRSSYDKDESRHRNRFHERKQSSSDDKYESGVSSDRYQPVHRFVSYVSAHSSKEHSRASSRDRWRISTDSSMDTDNKISGGNKAITKHRDRERISES